MIEKTNRLVLLTGGGTAGHVYPLFPIAEKLKEGGFIVKFVGTYAGIERFLVENAKYDFLPISAGKLRRYFSRDNFIDIFRTLAGIIQSCKIITKHKPVAIVSKGGFVSVPVCIAGWIKKIPVIIHESDRSPGLANRIAGRFASVIYARDENTLGQFKGKGKREIASIPLRSQFRQPDITNGLKQTRRTTNLPILLIMGGSLGSSFINSLVPQLFELIRNKFHVVHITGKDYSPTLRAPNYVAIEYTDDLPDIMAVSHIIISRGGATAIDEIITVKKPALIIPLSKLASRGDQLENAAAFEEQNYGLVLKEEQCTAVAIANQLDLLFRKYGMFSQALNLGQKSDPTEAIVGSIVTEVLNHEQKQ